MRITRFHILFILSFFLTLSLPLLPWVQITADASSSEQRTVGVRFVTADPPRSILTEGEARMGIVPQWETLQVQQTYLVLMNFGRFIFLGYFLLWFAIVFRYRKKLIAYLRKSSGTLSLFSFIGSITLLCIGELGLFLYTSPSFYKSSGLADEVIITKIYPFWTTWLIAFLSIGLSIIAISALGSPEK